MGDTVGEEGLPVEATRSSARVGKPKKLGVSHSVLVPSSPILIRAPQEQGS